MDWEGKYRHRFPQITALEFTTAVECHETPKNEKRSLNGSKLFAVNGKLRERFFCSNLLINHSINPLLGHKHIPISTVLNFIDKNFLARVVFVFE